MGRRSKIDDSVLAALFDQYFVEKCESEPGNIRIPEFAEYVRSNGYPDIQDYLVRRNETVRKRIAEIKEDAETAMIQSVVVFRSLDVEEFIRKNSSPAALKRALSEREAYYRRLSESAAYCVKHFKELSDKINSLMMKNADLQQENEQLSEEITSMKEALKSTDSSLKKLREIIDTYVYPEIANELLKNEGMLKNTAGIVSDETVETQVIHADTEIRPRSKIINNLFDKI